MLWEPENNLCIEYFKSTTMQTLTFTYIIHLDMFFPFFHTGPVLGSDQRSDSDALRGRSVRVWHPAAQHLPLGAASVPLPVAVQRPPQPQPLRQRQGVRQPAGNLDWKGECCSAGSRINIHQFFLSLKWWDNLQVYTSVCTIIKATHLSFFPTRLDSKCVAAFGKLCVKIAVIVTKCSADCG